jgi:HSP20 family protein
MTRTIAESPATVTSDWAGTPISTIHHPAPDVITIPLEQYANGRNYVYRMKLPGIDPVTDLTVLVRAGVLRVRAIRRGEPRGEHDQGFRPGTHARNVVLPPGVNVHDITAEFRNGILIVRIGMESEEDGRPRAIPVNVK